MFAVLLLGIGLVGIAALLPAAAHVHRQAADETLSQNVASGAINALAARKVDVTITLAVPVVVGGNVTNAPEWLDGNAITDWALADRCYPAHIDVNRNGIPNESTPDEDSDFRKRKFYWYPLFRQPTAGDWQVVVFVLRRYGANLAPVGTNVTLLTGNAPVEVDDVTNAAGSGIVTAVDAVGIRAGDMVADQEGRIYLVTLVDNNKDGTLTDITLSPPSVTAISQLWFGRRVTASTSRMKPVKIFVLGNEVIK